MKVVFRLSSLGFGGTERVFLSVADQLSKVYGWDVAFVVDQIRDHATEEVAWSQGYQVVGLGAARTWKTIWPFARYLSRERPDIVISAYTDTNGASLLSNALRLGRAATVVTEHAPLDEHWAGKSKLRRFTLEFTVRHVYKLADHVLCVSRGMVPGVTSRLKGRSVSHIHNPVRYAVRRQSRSEARRQLGIEPDTATLLAVGRISKPKNYAMLLQAFAGIRTQNAHLFIVGGVYETVEKEKLDRIVEANGLAARVHFVDFTHDVHTYYEAADLLVLSSAWEGFGNVLVEALAFGLPVVSTRCNHGPAEILDDGRYGVLVAVNDVTSMANAIDSVLEAPAFGPEAQMRRAQDFSEARIGAEYHDLICRVIEAKA